MTVCHLWSPKKNLKDCLELVDHYYQPHDVYVLLTNRRKVKLTQDVAPLSNGIALLKRMSIGSVLFF
jgi:hypothetical protein